MPRRKTFGTHQIHAEWWDAHEFVVIRELNAEDIEWLQDEATSLIADSKAKNDGKVDVKLLNGTQRRLTLVRGIVSWTFTDAHNNPMPMPAYTDNPKVIAQRLQSLRSLAPEDAQYIYEQLDKINQPMTAQEQDDFLDNASTGLEESQAPSHLQLLSAK